jgi:cysteine synthase A
MIAARRIREQFPELKTVVTILDDEGEKYLHDFFMHPAAGTDAPVPFH